MRKKYILHPNVIDEYTIDNIKLTQIPVILKDQRDSQMDKFGHPQPLRH